MSDSDSHSPGNDEEWNIIQADLSEREDAYESDGGTQYIVREEEVDEHDDDHNGDYDNSYASECLIADEEEECLSTDGEESADGRHLDSTMDSDAHRDIVDGHRLHHRYFDDGKYARLHTLADGSCFFHSVACALNYRDFSGSSRVVQTRLGRDLRGRVFTEERYAAFVSTIDASIRDLEDESGRRLVPTLGEARAYRYQANDALWRATAVTLGITILVVETPNTFYVTNASPTVRACVIIGWLERCHFEPIVAVDADTQSCAPPPEGSLARAEAVLDHTIVPRNPGGRLGVYDVNSPVVQLFLSRRSGGEC